MTVVEEICKTISYWGSAMLPFQSPKLYDIVAASEKCLSRHL